MKITILGATGPTGTQLVQQALAAGHDVTALVRDPARLSVDASKIRVVTGDATSTSDLMRALPGSEAVLSALGSGTRRATDVISRAAAAVVPAMRATGVSRLVWLSAFGVGTSIEHAGFVQKAVVRLAMKDVFADKATAEELIRASDLDWTFVYPGILTNGPATGRYRAQHDPAKVGMSRISRADVAGFMLAQAGRGSEWTHRIATLTA